MSVSPLREITLGVSNLPGRTHQFENGCGLSALTGGLLTSATAGRLFDTQVPPRASLLGRPDVPGSPRLRLVEVVGGLPSRTQGLRNPGALGTGFTTVGIAGVHARLQTVGVEFVSEPLLLPPAGAPLPPAAPPGPRRFETFGRTEDGDFIVLIERVRAETPYGTLLTDCSEPLHASFVVTNLDACVHFMRDTLEQETLLAETCAGPPFDVLLGIPGDAAFRFAMVHRDGFPTGRLVFLEFDKRLEPMPQTPALSRGLCRLRYDTTDLHSTLARVPGGGGTLVRGPASIADPVLGHGLVAMVRAPFGVLIELWQTQ